MSTSIKEQLSKAQLKSAIHFLLEGSVAVGGGGTPFFSRSSIYAINIFLRSSATGSRLR